MVALHHVFDSMRYDLWGAVAASASTEAVSVGVAHSKGVKKASPVNAALRRWCPKWKNEYENLKIKLTRSVNAGFVHESLFTLSVNMTCQYVCFQIVGNTQGHGVSIAW